MEHAAPGFTLADLSKFSRLLLTCDSPFTVSFSEGIIWEPEAKLPPTFKGSGASFLGTRTCRDWPLGNLSQICYFIIILVCYNLQFLTFRLLGVRSEVPWPLGRAFGLTGGQVSA